MSFFEADRSILHSLASSAPRHTRTGHLSLCQNAPSVREVSLQLNTQSFQIASWKLESSVWLTLPQSATCGMACLSKSTFHMQALPSVVGSFCRVLARFFQLAQGLNGISVGPPS